jgi:hypothetical protein
MGIQTHIRVSSASKTVFFFRDEFGFLLLIQSERSFAVTTDIIGV